MTPVKAIMLIAFVLITGACGSESPPQKPKTCLEEMPQRILGLKVRGARSEKNVIANMWPVMCKAQEVYRERLEANPTLKGTVELKLVVEFNGEIGPYSISRSTVRDPVLEERLLRLVSFMDFDPYGARNSDTEILLPIHFGS